MKKESAQVRAVRVQKIIDHLRLATKGMAEPAVTQIVREYGKKPFLALVTCLLSLRAKDVATLPIAKKLFERAHTPQELLAIPPSQLEALIRPIGFFRQKTRTLRNVAQDLIVRFDETVPQTEAELLSIKGIGRKTANLMLGELFGVPAICVDIHVHRISNRLGFVKSVTPAETERQLMTLLPRALWVEINRLLVMWGQNVCTPVSPFCSRCAIAAWCPRVGVTRAR